MLLSGCGNAIPELTDIQKDMVTEYAVGTVLKYSANYDDKIICREIESAEESEGVEEIEQEQQESLLEEKDMVDVSVGDEDEMEVAPSVSVNEVSVIQSIASFLAVDNFVVEYAGSEICDTYTGADDDVLAFELKASEGTKLLVLKYSVTNATNQKQKFDLLSQNLKAKISVAGNNRSALLTMLENDLLHADTIIGADETHTFVILTEVKSNVEVKDITLTLIRGEEKAKYTY